MASNTLIPSPSNQWLGLPDRLVEMTGPSVRSPSLVYHLTAGTDGTKLTSRPTLPYPPSASSKKTAALRLPQMVW